MVSLLSLHKVKQDAERRKAAQLWTEGGPPETDIETGQRNVRRLTQSHRAFVLLVGGGEGI